MDEGAWDRFSAYATGASREQHRWTPADGTLPSIYLGHGAPPLLDDELWMEQLSQWALRLPKPRAILIVSAHWEAAPANLTSPRPETGLVYDFWGFPERFYRMTYPTPDASDLARRIAATMPDREPVHQHRDRGLDHGAWVPLKAMYPLADVPTLQLSMPELDPRRLLDLGRRLRPLREEGVLLIGSGFMTHGLPYLGREHWAGRGVEPSWSRDFDAWAEDALGRGDVESLCEVGRAPGMPYAHPTIEHYSPLFVALGAAGDPETPPRTVIEGFWMGLSKRSIEVDLRTSKRQKTCVTGLVELGLVRTDRGGRSRPSQQSRATFRRTEPAPSTPFAADSLAIDSQRPPSRRACRSSGRGVSTPAASGLRPRRRRRVFDYSRGRNSP